ncbi:MAG: T9SS type A sorting domain-containing protein [Chitinophagaceae bacterium]|nr:MAG: T9SS type A sorting domain-containing protein [Chitinophagaceae bacterium]
MKQLSQQASSACSSLQSSKITKLVLAISFFFAATGANAQQAVSAIITDYNGYWKTQTGAYNSVKPANSHNLLAFTYNTRTYSTGVNDAALTANNQAFTAGDFWSLPVEGIAGNATGNTKVGVGQLYDGVHNGAGTVPSNDLKSYLTDGIKGLDIGTCVANLPAGDLTFFVNNINPAMIGDGIPDIVVTQVADPSGSFDRYSFVDNAGNVVGLSRDIVFTNIPPVGNWTADFWSANQNPMTLQGGFINTDRAIRLWAADLSEFGITAVNYQSIRKFKIRLSGDSDVAFVAYNTRTISITAVLPLNLNDFTAKKSDNNTVLNWSTSSEVNSNYFIVEKKESNGSFTAIDSVKANGNVTSVNYYSAVDRKVKAGTSYYRLRMVDADGSIAYSRTILVSAEEAKKMSVNIYPNPATSNITVDLPSSEASSLELYTASGVMVKRVAVAKNNAQVNVNLSTLNKGVYYIVWQATGSKLSQSFVIR